MEKGKIKSNPFRPGAGHSPPYLAGRESEVQVFAKFLEQDVVIKNVVLTGLRGVGKTVLMDDRFKPAALAAGWAWAGSDFSEQSFLTERAICARLLTDLSLFSSSLTITEKTEGGLGFRAPEEEIQRLDYRFLTAVFDAQPGLNADKLKAVLEIVWAAAERVGSKGIIFAYDEAQVVADQKDKEEYPLAMLLETFQSLQKKKAKYMLLLTGLPTLFAKLVESRTYAERMFAVQEIGRITPEASREAITVPLQSGKCPWSFDERGVERIIATADGYPYFIQFICREALDYLMATESFQIPMDPIIRKLDCDFFAGRWEVLTDRQRDLLYAIAQLKVDDGEFSIPDIVEKSRHTTYKIKPFSNNDVSQVLPRLIDKGLIYKSRTGRYSFAVPLFGGFVNRKYAEPGDQPTLVKMDD